MKYILLTVLFLSFSFNSGMASQEDTLNRNNSSFIENVGIGSAAGAGEVAANQPLIYFKNQIQQMNHQQKKQGITKFVRDTIKESPRQIYRGLGVNLAGMVPTTAAQISINEKLKELIPGMQIKTSLFRNALAGAGGAVLCNPIELVIVNQQNWKMKAWPAIRRLYAENGLHVVGRGLTGKCVRDSIFCAGFLTGYPWAEQVINNVIHNLLLAKIGATLLVTPPTAFASHLFDTHSTRSQADPGKKVIRGFLHGMGIIYQEGGIGAFFGGLVPRTYRMLVAIPVMSAIKDALSGKE